MTKGILVAPAVAELEIHVRTLAEKSSFASIIQEPIGYLELRVDHPECRLTSGTHLPIDTTRNLLVARMATSVSLRPAYGAITVTAKRSNGGEGPTPRAPVEPPSVPAQTQFEGLDESEKQSPLPKGTPTAQKAIDQIVVELPVRVGRTGSRLLGAALISVAIAAHAFEVEHFEDHGWLVGIKVGLILGAAFLALMLGMKPQGGS